MTSNN